MSTASFSISNHRRERWLEATLIVVLLVISQTGIVSLVHARDRYTLNFQETPEQTVIWQNGVQAIFSELENSSVLLTAVNDQLPDDQSTFRIVVLNSQNSAVNFGPEDIWFEILENTRLTMADPQDLEGRHRRDLDRRRALAAFSGAFAPATGQRSGTTTFHGSTSNGTTFAGSGTYSTYDPDLAQKQREQATAQTANMMQSLQVRQLNGEESLNNLLRRNSIQPQQIVAGTVAYDPTRSFRRMSESSPIVIVVQLGAEEHRITATVSKIP